MFKISKKIIIVEIENPKLVGGISNILNKYWYSGFLKDVGENYLSQSEFKTIILNNFNDISNINFYNFKNIMGNYMIAEITKKE